MISLPQLRGNGRLGAWCLLCLLTLLIFLYPTKLEIIYAPVESIYVFSNLPLFGALYYAWFALILVLLLFPGGEQGSRDWENIALVAIFALGFSGIWVSLSHGYYQTDTFAYAGQIKTSLSKGHLWHFPVGGPVEFPILPLLGIVISQIAGLEIFDTIMAILLLQILLLCALFYVLFRNLLKDGRLASLATMMIMGGNLISDFLPQFHPRIFVMLFLVACLALLTKDKPAMSESWQRTLLFIILLAAMAMTHLVNAFVFFLILLGIYLVQRLGKASLVTLSLVILAFIANQAWAMYVATSLSGHAVSHLPLIWKNLLNAEFIDLFSRVGVSNNIGAAMPLWANVIIIFWLVLMVLGGLLGFRNLLRIRRMSSARQKEVGGLVGIAIFAIIASLAQGVAETSWRISFFLIPFTVAIFLSFLSSLRAHARRLAFIVLIVLVLVLSFPTFLAHNDNVGMNIFLPTEISPAKFLGAYSEGIDSPWIVTSVPTDGMMNYYIPNPYDTVFPAINIPFGAYPALDEIFRQLDETVNRFKSGHEFKGGKERWASISLFVFSPRYAYEIKYLVGYATDIDVATDPRWQKAMSEVAQENMVYNNGVFQIYQARGNR